MSTHRRWKRAGSSAPACGGGRNGRRRALPAPAPSRQTSRDGMLDRPPGRREPRCSSSSYKMTWCTSRTSESAASAAHSPRRSSAAACWRAARACSPSRARRRAGLLRQRREQDGLPAPQGAHLRYRRQARSGPGRGDLGRRDARRACKPKPEDHVLRRTCSMDGSYGTGLYAILRHLRREQLVDPRRVDHARGRGHRARLAQSRLRDVRRRGLLRRRAAGVARLVDREHACHCSRRSPRAAEVEAALSTGAAAGSADRVESARCGSALLRRSARRQVESGGGSSGSFQRM